MNEELSAILWRFSQEIIKIVKNAKMCGKIHKIRKLWIREKITDFKYQEGSISWSSSTEYFEKEEWDWKDKFQIIEQEIKKLSSYIKAYKAVSTIYGVEEAQSEILVDRFTSCIVDKTLNEEIEEETLVDVISTFLNDLEKNPIMWNVSAEIEGLWLKDDEIILGSGIKLRKPKSSDLEYEQPFELLVSPLPRPMFRSFSAILEVNQRAKLQPFIWNEFEKLIIALRLYKLGSIKKGVVRWKPKSILQLGGTTWSDAIQPVIYKYSLAKEDCQKIQNFLGRIKPLLPLTQGGIETTSYISIALQRYNDALFKTDPTERIAYGIMGLEALFLKSLEREELSHKLSQRVAKCLNIFGYQPLESYRIIKQSYEIRSEFIHGSIVSEDKCREASKLADKIMEYLRLSILMLLELQEKIDKENFLNTVDNSLLHPDAQSKLQILIKENCKATQNVIVAS